MSQQVAVFERIRHAFPLLRSLCIRLEHHQSYQSSSQEIERAHLYAREAVNPGDLLACG